MPVIVVIVTVFSSCRAILTFVLLEPLCESEWEGAFALMCQIQGAFARTTSWVQEVDHPVGSGVVWLLTVALPLRNHF